VQLAEDREKKRGEQKGGEKRDDDLVIREAVTSFILSWFRPLDEEAAATVRKRAAVENRLSILEIPSLPRPFPLGRTSMYSSTSTSTTQEATSSSEEDEDVDSEEDFVVVAQKKKPLPRSPPKKSRSSRTRPSMEKKESIIALKNDRWTISGLNRAAMDDFFSWAFFAEEVRDLSPEQSRELQAMYEIVEREIGLVFAADHAVRAAYQPRRLNFETVSPIHRPLAVYWLVQGIQFCTGLSLRRLGFQRIQSSTGLAGWHRPAAKATSSSSLQPFVFFHGIAPGGLVLYLPMILFGLCEHDRPCFLFDNPNIASSRAFSFDALTEEETVRGVTELVNQCEPDCSGLILCGHSFGSCPITWLLLSKTLPVSQVVLMDPITVMLSHPDVMINFLYAHELQSAHIRMVASSELFTEHYLRRHFYWYNAELWWEDLHHQNVRTVVALSERDEIVHAPHVKQYLDLYGGDDDKLETIYWPNTGHADCVMSPAKWKQIKQAMLRQELALVQQQQKQTS
jgi:pimeloyl-ACP methyl ester carboxylesterase